ncbi:class IV adenylate cyclase [Pseudacidobacterium ailaaui]|jgi:adenylate cyclase class 2|uniref:class IV adenylate cyclase n=1 Tax=Pseudacidobacterium ailaaui TaxID=1382359 RepID=UPI00047D71AD|nr:class IV adenylate cyclase [Pseudacidobacterium ailaaui]MDI3254339.1 class IV adenylate cyclase [Bacillota bacterium]
MSAVEIEVKFRVADAAALEQKLFSLGFRQITPRTFERNVLFDTSDRALRAKQSILRLRRYGKQWIVTHKCLPPGHEHNSRHKHRVETETEVKDGEAMATIFAELGYKPAFTYEKWRTEYADSIGHCVLDETPIGLFAELEGPDEWIDAIAKKLGLSPSEMLTLSYGRLFEEWRARTGMEATDLTFEAVGAAR